MARELCWAHSVHPRDAIHLATAIESACECVETNDSNLLRYNGKLGTVQLIIRAPAWSGQLGLPEVKDNSAESRLPEAAHRPSIAPEQAT